MNPHIPYGPRGIPGLILIVGLACLGARTGVAADDRAPVPALRPALETTLDSARRFAVHGGAADERAELLAWATTVAARYERFRGTTIPWPEGTPHHIYLQRDPAQPGGIQAWQEAAADAPRQRIIIVNPSKASLFELTLALTRHLLVRERYGTMKPELLIEASGRLPYWYVAGQARAMDPESRNVDLQCVIRALGAGTWPDLDRLLRAAGPRELNDDETAALAQLVRWLKARPEFVTFESALWQEAAAGPCTWDAARLGARISPPQATRGLKQDWDLHLAVLRGLRLPREMTTADLAGALRRTLCIPRSRLPAPVPAEAPELITPRTLVACRRAPWAQALAARMRNDLFTLPVAQDEAVVAVTRVYAEVLDILSRPPPRPPWSWITIAPGNPELHARLATAEATLKALETPPEPALQVPPQNPAEVPPANK